MRRAELARGEVSGAEWLTLSRAFAATAAPPPAAGRALRAIAWLGPAPAAPGTAPLDLVEVLDKALEEVPAALNAAAALTLAAAAASLAAAAAASAWKPPAGVGFCAASELPQFLVTRRLPVSDMSE